ncbi:MAG: pyridoxamine 5'-phosphate oxidase [Methanobacteriota archaeon]|nr:MAG: pyridoxamine 5'-phosphate oxidase [Euryarchaeota archaeon]
MSFYQLTSMDLPNHVRKYIAQHQVLNLSYSDQEGPQACAVFYALTRDNRFVFVSDRKTRHGTALAKGEIAVAFTINEDNQEWENIQGIQGRGIVKEPQGIMAEKYKAIYLDRFPFILNSSRLVSMINKIEFWELTPFWIRFINNQVKFGFKEEFSNPEFP